ncbi:XRE family transcriptional regulator, partial [Staphylococcus simulans]
FKEIRQYSKSKDRFKFVFNIENEEELTTLKNYVNILTPGLKNVLFKRIQKHLSNYVSAIIKENVEDHEALFLPNDEKITLYGVISQTYSFLESDIFKEY